MIPKQGSRFFPSLTDTVSRPTAPTWRPRAVRSNAYGGNDGAARCASGVSFGGARCGGARLALGGAVRAAARVPRSWLVAVLDATALERHLYLALCLIETGRPTVLARLGTRLTKQKREG